MNKGFTLVELAIVIVIIGLLIGGVLQGQELIKQSQRQSLIKHVTDISANATIFYSKYNAIAGDMPNATNLFTGSTFYVAVANGDGDSQLDYSNETQQFWVHLDKSKIYFKRDGSQNGEPVKWPNASHLWPLSTKNFDYFYKAGTYQKMGNNFLYLWGNSPNGASAEEGGIGAEDIAFIDSKIDDGKPLSGVVQADQSYNSSSGAYGPCISSSAYILTSNNRDDCIARFYMNF